MISRGLMLMMMLALVLSSDLRAQQHPYVPRVAPKDTSTFLIFNDVTAGPYFTGGISQQQSNIPDGWHASPRFSYIFGVTSDFSINPWIGFDLGMSYDTRDLYLATSGDSDNIDFTFGYISIEPAIRIAWLLLGIAFDIPVSGNAQESIALYEHPGQTTGPYKQNIDAPTSDLSGVTELRAALSIPILKAESGVLHLVASANWPLTKTSLQGTSFDTTGHFHAAGQGPLPAFEAGFSYQFDLLH